VTRRFGAWIVAAWGLAAALLFWLAPGVGATYLVASGWVAVGALAVWLLVRYPPFRKTTAARRRGPPAPDPDSPDP
jgi:hypothetical protein